MGIAYSSWSISQDNSGIQPVWYPWPFICWCKRQERRSCRLPPSCTDVKGSYGLRTEHAHIWTCTCCITWLTILDETMNVLDCRDFWISASFSLSDWVRVTPWPVCHQPTLLNWPMKYSTTSSLIWLLRPKLSNRMFPVMPPTSFCRKQEI
jgi:hypothetical protein